MYTDKINDRIVLETLIEESSTGVYELTYKCLQLANIFFEI